LERFAGKEWERKGARPQGRKKTKRKIESAFVFVCFASWRLCVQMNCTKEVLKNELARFNLRSPLDDDETNFRPIAL
jgi:hypothetical protein